MDNRQQLIDWVSKLIKDLTVTPSELSIKAIVDERGLLIEVFSPSSMLGQLIGKGGRNAEALRSVISMYGNLHEARIGLKITDSTR